MKKSIALALSALATAAPVIALAPSAAAGGMPVGDGQARLHASLNPITVNKVTGSGTARVRLAKGSNEAHVRVDVKGLLAGAPHAQHFHIQAKGKCPPVGFAKKHNGKPSVSTPDAQPFYGKIGTSLTTKGDTSPDSALAVKRFPMGPNFHYERTIKLSDAAARAVRADNAVVVVHGIDYNGNGKYDFNLGKSPLDPKLPLEATAPALCGPLTMAAKGPVAGGEGGSQPGGMTGTAAAAGGVLLIGAAGAFYLRRRTGAARS